MITTAVVVLCHLLVAHPTIAPERDCTPEEAMVEEIVTDSNQTEGLTASGCQIGSQVAISKWKNEHPIYRSPLWRVARINCVMGHYEIRGRA